MVGNNMKRLVEIEDVGCGDYGTRSKHYCYINIPQEYIIETEEKLFSTTHIRLSLTKEGEEFVENNVPRTPHGYLSYKYVTNEHRDSIIEVYKEKISRLQFELNELENMTAL